ncbi:class I SAM-dependent methyltransferase [Octadecabacter sp. G9-8]|uniref:Class I SAM-dependent methyltransferase n=1 Tax=Octadecabacter dasysiphoniae TaxID=2909341 RepID=A0ABS9CX91_9RHOB|nr:class I SAM-dependent methyltransferase [Octadecabacter dasysiphoniae]MCF2871819.1 class I SAM-dependent methyltransferase [Octadecabacter dasysiphoniae]
MTVDHKTIAVYNEKAAEYAKHFDTDSKPGAHVRRFIEAVPTGGRVLDLGCGTAGASRHMLAAGLDVDAMDASPEMIRVAAHVNGVTARLGTFDDLNAKADYDGIWANFSLLHAPRDKLPDYLAAIATALRPNGTFHIGMKTGTGTTRDHINRKYTFVTQDELSALLNGAGFDIQTIMTGHEVGLAGTDDPWIVILSKVANA